VESRRERMSAVEKREEREGMEGVGGRADATVWMNVTRGPKFKGLIPRVAALGGAVDF
jgi:hypothetical protein